MEAHFVTFASPGTFTPETSQLPIDGWDVEAAKQMALSITERHGATPYGFYFSTRSRGPDDLDSKASATSNFYYLGGRIETYDEIVARNDPSEAVLRNNMQMNRYVKVIVNDNSWRFTTYLRDTDVILDFTPPVRA